MDLKVALNKLKSGGGNLSIPFFFCELGANGKPVVLVGPITSDAKAKALAGAKSKKTAMGKMSLSSDGELFLKAKGTALSSVVKGVTKAAEIAGARSLFKTAKLGEPDDADDDDDDNDEDDPNKDGKKRAVPPATAKAPAPAPVSKPARPVSANTHAYSDVPDGRAKPPATHAYGDVSDGRANARGTSGYGAVPAGSANARGGSGYNAVPDGRVNAGGGANYDDVTDLRADPKSGKTYDDVAAVRAAPPGQSVYDVVQNFGQAPGPAKRNVSTAAGPAKSFPDVLRKSPAMASLLNERDELRAAILKAEKEEGAHLNQRAVKQMLVELQAVENDIEEEQKKLNETGLVPQPMGKEYVDEDKKVGWIVEDKPEPPPIDPAWTPQMKQAAETAYQQKLKSWEETRDSEVSVRKNFTEAEKKKAALAVNAEGLIVDADGKTVTTPGGGEYVTDAKDGKMYQFTPGRQKTGLQKPVGTSGRTEAQEIRTHHSSVLSGKEVGSAGGLDVQDGVVKHIDNISGHYKPGIGPMVQTVEGLIKQGALLDQAWVGKDGKPLAGKEAELHKRVLVLQKQVAKKLETNPQLDVTAERANIDKAIAMLNKLGAGPANKIRSAKVGFLDIKEGTDGAVVKAAAAAVKKNAIPAEEFLRTGGGNQTQAKAKVDMQAELQQQGATKRDQLEKSHTVAGQGSAGPSEEEIEAAAKTLKADKDRLKHGGAGSVPNGPASSPSGGVAPVAPVVPDAPPASGYDPVDDLLDAGAEADK